MEYIGVDRLISQPVLDPAYVSVTDYVAATTNGQEFAANRVTPPILAGQLEADAEGRCAWSRASTPPATPH